MKIKLEQGCNFRIICLLLRSIVGTDGCFVITRKHIVMNGADKKEDPMKMISIKLYDYNFTTYSVGESDRTIGVNLDYLCSMINSIRKKDSLTLRIRKANPNELVLRYKPKAEATINITPTQRSEPDMDMYTFSKPIVVTPNDFNKIRALEKIVKYTTVTYNNGILTFCCENSKLFKRMVSFGSLSNDSETDSEYYSSSSDDEEYSAAEGGDEDGEGDGCDDLVMDEIKQTYVTESILDLTKVASISSKIKIYISTEQSLKFEFFPRNLGKVTVLLKAESMS